MFEELHGYVINGDNHEVRSFVRDASARRVEPSDLLNEGLIVPMKEIDAAGYGADAVAVDRLVLRLVGAQVV